MTEAQSDWTDEELDNVAQALQNASIPLQTTDPDESLDGLEALRDTLSEPTVIGIGEVTHGARPVFRCRNRIARFLAEELDFQTFALELNFGGAQTLNEYITNGTGTPREAITRDGLHMFWQCDATAEFLEWARTVNESRDSGNQVQIHGVDVQYTKPAAENIAAYLEQVDTDLRYEVSRELDYLNRPYMGFLPPKEEPSQFVDACQNLASTLEPALEDNQARYIGNSSEQEFERIVRQVTHIRQRGEMVRVHLDGDEQKPPELRDKAMAETVSWLVETEQVDSVAVLAHNIHVNRSRLTDGMWEGCRPMGAFLAEQQGLDYHTIGVSIGSDSYSHVTIDDPSNLYDPSVSCKDIEIPEPPRASLPAVLSRMEHERAIVNFDELPEGSLVDDWLASKPKRHQMQTDADDPVAFKQTDPRNDFDSLVFIQHPTSAHRFE